MTEYWVSQARHWCEYCKIYINGSKSSIAFHEQGRKHKEIVELFLKDMRKRNRERKIERQDLDRELAKIERDAAKASRSVLCAFLLRKSSRVIPRTSNPKLGLRGCSSMAYATTNNPAVSQWQCILK